MTPSAGDSPAPGGATLTTRDAGGATAVTLDGMDPVLLSRIEDAGLNASAPTEQRWLDGWLLRLSPGKVKRARCINAVADGRLPFADRLAIALDAYRDAGLPPLFRVTPFSRPSDLDARLDAIGWSRFDDTRVMVLGDLQATLGADADAPSAAALVAPPAAVTPLEYADIVGTLRGSPRAHREAHARRLHTSPVASAGFAVRDGSLVLACGRFAREGDLVGLYDIFTAPQARGRGLAGSLCHWMLRRAASEGARRAYLQVEGDNAAARAVYRRLGFVDAYAYHYRGPEPPAA